LGQPCQLPLYACIYSKNEPPYIGTLRMLQIRGDLFDEQLYTLRSNSDSEPRTLCPPQNVTLKGDIHNVKSDSQIKLLDPKVV